VTRLVHGNHHNPSSSSSPISHTHLCLIVSVSLLGGNHETEVGHTASAHEIRHTHSRRLKERERESASVRVCVKRGETDDEQRTVSVWCEEKMMWCEDNALRSAPSSCPHTHILRHRNTFQNFRKSGFDSVVSISISRKEKPLVAVVVVVIT
jgi:hypothetical protein